MTSINIKLEDSNCKDLEKLKEYFQTSNAAVIRWALRFTAQNFLPKTFSSENVAIPRRVRK